MSQAAHNNSDAHEHNGQYKPTANPSCVFRESMVSLVGEMCQLDKG
jgi:hypothetical protein